jgi:hypothetical protein
MALTLLSASVYGQVPTTNDTSDPYFNTGIGTDALLSITPVAGIPNVGFYNTATGYQSLYSNSTGYENTAVGYWALFSNQGTQSTGAYGSYNSAFGSQALYGNTTGYDNTAAGWHALYANRAGYGNSAFGAGALRSNTNANYNTAVGYYALSLNTTGTYNAAFGFQALKANTTGGHNTAAGYAALYSNTIGMYNTASGENAMVANNKGSTNAAFGASALRRNTTGSNNAASGYNALFSNESGGSNTAAGYEALYSNTTGQFNIGVGYQAGYNLTIGTNNIDIGNPGVVGESGVIRIGTQVPTALQTNTYIAGIYTNTLVSGLPVVVDANGQLGVAAVSSERFKMAIAPMGSDTAKLQQLRAVTFKYKADPEGTRRYGLIAEEVAKFYPELIVRDNKGRIDGVRYDELAPMLLNEVQKQQKKLTTQEQRIATLDVLLHEMRQQIAQLKRQVEVSRLAKL